MVPLHPEDQEIIEVAQDLCRQLNIYKLTPRTVSWIDRIGIRKVPLDYIFLFQNAIRLPKPLMGKLKAEDWRPLLASSLIYFNTLSKDMFVGMLRTIVPATLAFPLILVIAFRFFPFQSLLSQATFFSIIALFIIFYAFMFVRWFGYQKRLQFKADRRAVDLVGKEQLLEALKKIESLGAGKGNVLSRAVRPSIQERIDKLSGP